MCHCFNPSKVHLEHYAVIHDTLSVGCFNPSKVHLEPVRERGSWDTDARFNPSKVHLEPRSSDCPEIAMSWLQPLKGASGTAQKSCLSARVGGFNPSKVHLELHAKLFLAVVFAASTPQRCIWNSTAFTVPSSLAELQPLKGASGTARAAAG